MTRKRAAKPEVAPRVLTVVCPEGDTLAYVVSDEGRYVVTVRHYSVGDASPASALGYAVRQGPGGIFRLVPELETAGGFEIACGSCGRDDFHLVPRDLLEWLRQDLGRVVLDPYGL